MTTIYLIRHGESISNVHKDALPSFHKQWGEFEGGVTEKGRKQAKELGEKITINSILKKNTEYIDKKGN